MSETAKDQLKVLVAAIDAFGHINSALGMVEILVKRGHDVYFANRRKHRALSEKHGAKFIALEDYDPSYTDEGTAVFLNFTQSMLDSKDAAKSSGEPYDEDAVMASNAQNRVKVLAQVHQLDKICLTIIADISPDIFIGDFGFQTNLFKTSSVPCIPIHSANPLPLYSKYGIPSGLGLSVRSPREVVNKITEKKKTMLETSDHQNKVESSTGNDNPIDSRSYCKYFGIYVYPEALDYTDLGEPPSKWFRMDCSIRQPETEFVIPEVLKSLPGKLVYFSMGSIGSSNLNIMSRLINSLSKSPHRFIVSKGPRGNELTLPGNMWGENYVDQIAVLPKVDLVITHGGNNTLIETLYFGKPMICMPLFYDQLDNAQRLEDTKLGHRIDPFIYTDDQLLATIDELANNLELHERLSAISARMKESKSREKAAQLIEILSRTGISPI